MTESNRRVPGGIQQLILDRIEGRSYEALSRDCGGQPGNSAIWKIMNKQIKNFPDPETIQALARGLNVPARSVLLAYGRSLGLEVGDDGVPDALVLVGAQNLPKEAQDTLITMSRTLLNAYAAGEGGDWGDGR